MFLDRLNDLPVLIALQTLHHRDRGLPCQPDDKLAIGLVSDLEGDGRGAIYLVDMVFQPQGRMLSRCR